VLGNASTSAQLRHSAQNLKHVLVLSILHVFFLRPEVEQSLSATSTGRKRWSPDVRLTEPLQLFRDATDGTQLNHAWPHGNCTGFPASQTKRNFFIS